MPANVPGTDAPSLRIRDWDAATKLAGILALFAAGLWALWVNHQTSRQQAAAAELDAQKPFATKRLEVYDRLVNLTSAISQADQPASVLRTRRQELDQIVNGPLALVAQDKVFAAIDEFLVCLNNRRCGKGSLMRYSRNVARSCRTSLEESWKVNLPPVPSSDRLP